MKTFKPGDKIIVTDCVYKEVIGCSGVVLNYTYEISEDPDDPLHSYLCRLEMDEYNPSHIEYCLSPEDMELYKPKWAIKWSERLDEHIF